MRKLLSIVLCLVMVFCFTVPAMAAEVEVGFDTAVIKPVEVKIQAGSVYKVTVDWDNELVFTYNFGTWDVNNADGDNYFLQYEPAGWGEKVRNITVRNYSNEKVGVKATLKNDEVNGVKFALLEGSNSLPGTFDLASADIKNGAYASDERGQVQERAFTLNVDGTPNAKNATIQTELSITFSK